jgi:hypothetical protein
LTLHLPGRQNDPRDATIATNLANYSISPALAITEVAVGGNVVTLTTAQPPPDVPSALPVTPAFPAMVNHWYISGCELLGAAPMEKVTVVFAATGQLLISLTLLTVRV